MYVVSRGEGHRRLAAQLGATWVGDDASKVPAKADSAILFAPSGKLVSPALQSLDRGGTLSLAGIHMTPSPLLDYDRDLFYERDVHPGTANTRDDARELLSEAAAAQVRPHTATYPLADANRSLQDLKSGRVDGTAVLIVR